MVINGSLENIENYISYIDEKYNNNNYSTYYTIWNKPNGVYGIGTIQKYVFLNLCRYL
jgi:hypothetical protein